MLPGANIGGTVYMIIKTTKNRRVEISKAQGTYEENLRKVASAGARLSQDQMVAADSHQAEF